MTTSKIWLKSLRHYTSQGRTKLGLVITFIVLVVAISGPFLAPFEPAQFVGRPFQPPDGTFLLGTDFRGRDVLSRLLNGGYLIVWMSFVAATIGIVLGTTVGLVAAYMRGWVNEVLMRFMDVFLSIPTIMLVLLVVALMGTQPWLIVVLVGISHMPQVARIVQGVAADYVERDFVRYAEALNVPKYKIMFGEILPNIMTPLLVEYGIRIVWSIAGIAALSVMGYGIQAPIADWGLMINENRGRIATRPLPVFAPALCIAIFAVGVNLIAEGVASTVSGVARKTAKKK